MRSPSMDGGDPPCSVPRMEKFLRIRKQLVTTLNADLAKKMVDKNEQTETK